MKEKCPRAEGSDRDARIWKLPPVVPFNSLTRRLESYFHRLLETAEVADREQVIFPRSLLLLSSSAFTPFLCPSSHLFPPHSLFLSFFFPPPPPVFEIETTFDPSCTLLSSFPPVILSAHPKFDDNHAALQADGNCRTIFPTD